MQTISGNLVKLAQQGKFDYIVHGCNCFCRMRSGIAKQISETFPEAVMADNDTIRGNRLKLGGYSIGYHQITESKVIGVVNAYTQYYYSRLPGDLFEYDAFDVLLLNLSVTLAVAHQKYDRPLEIGFPQIGAGLAQGNWSVIYRCLEKFAKRTQKYCRVTIVEYDRT